MSKSKRKLMFIISRNLGDAFIQSLYVNRIVEVNPCINFIIWLKPEFKVFFTTSSKVEFVECNFPMGTTKKNIFNQFVTLLRSLVLLKRMNIDLGIDFIGDFREILLLKISSQKSISISHDHHNPYLKLIRRCKFINPNYSYHNKKLNIYATYEDYIDYICNRFNLKKAKKLSSFAKVSKPYRQKIIIGISPFASLRCNTWPIEYWKRLLLLFNKTNRYSFKIFMEQNQKKDIFDVPFKNIEYIQSPLEDFITSIQGVDIFISNDSFASHVASSYLNILSFIIYGANMPEIMRPPNSTYLSNSGKCPYYPCFNKPKCMGGPNEYACLKSITPENLYNLINKKIHSLL